MINPYNENMAIILEISKFFGKDINLVIAYDIFLKINQKVVKDQKQGGYTASEIRNMYVVALQNLKY